MIFSFHAHRVSCRLLDRPVNDEQIALTIAENASEMAAELAACKAKERAKTVGVGRAQIILNELCLEMVARVGRVDGMHIPSSKGKALRDVRLTHSP